MSCNVPALETEREYLKSHEGELVLISSPLQEDVIVEWAMGLDGQLFAGSLGTESICVQQWICVSSGTHIRPGLLRRMEPGLSEVLRSCMRKYQESAVVEMDIFGTPAPSNDRYAAVECPKHFLLASIPTGPLLLWEQSPRKISFPRQWPGPHD